MTATHGAKLFQSPAPVLVQASLLAQPPLPAVVPPRALAISHGILQRLRYVCPPFLGSLQSGLIQAPRALERTSYSLQYLQRFHLSCAKKDSHGTCWKLQCQSVLISHDHVFHFMIQLALQLCMHSKWCKAQAETSEVSELEVCRPITQSHSATCLTSLNTRWEMLASHTRGSTSQRFSYALTTQPTPCSTLAIQARVA